MRLRRKPDWAIEARFAGRVVAGIDEAGRGPWAGPVVAAAVVLDPARVPAGIDDSKRLEPIRREALAVVLTRDAQWGIGEASVAEIATLNILGATFLAMQRALGQLAARAGRLPDLALVDGNRPPPLACGVETVVGGDGKSLSIAAASILAKTARDRIMRALAAAHPGYGWERNAGYGTAEHRRALDRLGLTPHHRITFKPIHNLLIQRKES